jgi:hypothetical protein
MYSYEVFESNVEVCQSERLMFVFLGSGYVSD